MIGPLSYKMFMCPRLRIFSSIQRYYASTLESQYTESEKEKILRILNDDISSLPRYDITKVRIKKLTDFLGKNGDIKTLTEIETIDGFTEKTTTKLFKSLLNGPQENENLNKKIKGQILHPTLSENDRQSCKTILAVYVTVNSICWSLIQKQDYVVDEWQYHGIDYPDGKKMQITDILNMEGTSGAGESLPESSNSGRPSNSGEGTVPRYRQGKRDVRSTAIPSTLNVDYCNIRGLHSNLNAVHHHLEATTLRATGSDPNNPKVLGINLQKAQLVAMMVALLNAKNYSLGDMGSDEDSTQSDQLKQRVYFLRPALPFRLYGTLVGNERVSTDQTVDEILREASSRKSNSHVFVPENLVNEYRNLTELKKDMLGQCLLLALTFMDICIYKNKESINKLLKRGE